MAAFDTTEAAFVPGCLDTPPWHAAGKMDTLSLILDDMHFDGVVFASTHNTAPWAWQLATPGLASFHIVTSGQAWLMRENLPPTLIQTGDLLVLPAGSAHRIQDKPQTLAVPDDLLPIMAQGAHETPQLHGGGGAA